MRTSKLLLALALALAVGAVPMQGQSTFKLLHGFLGGNDGANPVTGVTLGRNGSLYGITPEGGGSANGGVIFYISPAGWYKVIHTFTGGADGKSPYSRLLAMGGSFYGTTYQGGAYGGGTIFKITPSGAMTVLYNFSGPDGAGAYGPLMHDAAGNIYGTTCCGGTYSHGTVFRVDSSGVETSLYSFMGGTDGDTPMAGLVRDSKGNLYGTTLYGGANSCGSYNCGTLFKIDSKGVESILYNFGGYPLHDGELPESTLVEDMAGNLYGTTQWQAANTVFMVNQAGQETILYTFGGSYGTFPGFSLVRDTGGNLYGTVGGGGAYSHGGVFKLEPNGTYTLLYSFTGVLDGADPWDGVVRDSVGNLYGTTAIGGVSRKYGTVFELTFP